MKTRFVVAAACTSLFAGALITYGAPKLLSGKPAYATPGVNFNTTVLGRGTVSGFIFGKPTTATVTRKVTIRTKTGVFRRTFKFKVPSTWQSTARTAATRPFSRRRFRRAAHPGGTRIRARHSSASARARSRTTTPKARHVTPTRSAPAPASARCRRRSTTAATKAPTLLSSTRCTSCRRERRTAASGSTSRSRRAARAFTELT